MPTSEGSAVKGAAAPVSDRHAVTVTLSAEAYAYYSAQAADDDRTLAKYLARELEAQFKNSKSNL